MLQITGLDQINKKLKELDSKVGKKIVRKALRIALKPMQQKVKANVPVDTGQTKRAIKILAGKTKKGRISIRVVLGKGYYKGDSFYGAFQEFGHFQGSRKLGASRKEIPGKHFMRDAFEAEKEHTKSEAERLILEGINEAIKGN